MGLRARVLEAADGVGGTWYWNRYPGARCEVESLDYQYSFSDELLREWQWTERYPAQEEILRYLRHVAARFDLDRDVSLNTRALRDPAAIEPPCLTLDGQDAHRDHERDACSCTWVVNGTQPQRRHRRRKAGTASLATAHFRGRTPRRCDQRVGVGGDRRRSSPTTTGS